MLMGALAAFTLVAAMGLAMLIDLLRGNPIDKSYPLLHASAALVGSGLAIGAALNGDNRLWINIGLAVVIIVLGILMGIARKKGKPVPKGLIAAHSGLAVICYGLLAALAMLPQLAFL